MKRTATLALALAISTLVLGSAKADTTFYVEHARADARAGLTSEYEEELLERWGRLSGNYPPPDFGVAPYRRLKFRHHDWHLRRR